MSSNESEATELFSSSEMSRDEHDEYELIELLDGNYPSVKYLEIKFNLTHLDMDPSDAEVEITLRDTLLRSAWPKYVYTIRDPAELEQLGVYIGRCSSIRKLGMRMGVMYHVDVLNPEACQCIETLYRGLESNNSIEKFELDVDLIPSSELLPTFNLNGAQFKENLKDLVLSSRFPIGINQNLMPIIPLLESTSLENLSIYGDQIPAFTNEAEAAAFTNEAEAAFRAIISACTSVQRLHVDLMNTTECATTVATLFRDQRSILTEFSWCSCCENISAENLSIILDGLTSNTTLKKLDFEHTESLPCFSDRVARSQFERLLCNASSIEGIHNSNHTLEALQVLPDLSVFNSIQAFFSPLIRDCMELNKNTNKDTVIRTKIARYYFRGEFDISPFVNMGVKLLPNLMGMIEGDAISPRDAIYRLLRGIPDLFTFACGQP